MSRKYRIGLKYCGGCAPRYDRVEAVKDLRERLPEGVELVSYEDPDIEGVQVVAGCPTACVDLTPFKEYPVWVITSRQGNDDFVATILTGDIGNGLKGEDDSSPASSAAS